MDTPAMDTPATPLMGRRRKLALTAAILLAVTALFGSGVLAVFTDTATSGGNTFSSGDVDLTVAPVTAAVTMSGMAPGDRVTNPINVTNSGGLDLRYAVESATTENVLAGALQLTVKSGVATCTTAGFSGSGTVVYGPAALGNTTPLPVVGNATQGQQAGDRVLASAASEPLCVDVQLPISSGDSTAGLSTTATFTFYAEQTDGNP